MSKTYEEIKQRVLNNTDINVDKREGSFLNDMASPLSYELAKFYIEQQDLVNMAFVKNGYFNYLDIKCEEYGISRKQGIKSVGEVIFTGENGTLISNGTILVADDLYFVVLKVYKKKDKITEKRPNLIKYLSLVSNSYAHVNASVLK